MTQPTSEAHTALDVDALAQEIRRVDGGNSLGAGALAEALVPFIAALSTQQGNEPVAWRCKDYADGWMLYQFRENAEAYQKETGCLMEPLFASPPSPNSEITETAKDLLASLDPDALNPEQFNAWSALTALTSQKEAE